MTVFLPVLPATLMTVFLPVLPATLMTVFLPVLPATIITTCNTILFATILTACSSILLPLSSLPFFSSACRHPYWLLNRSASHIHYFFLCGKSSAVFVEDQCDVSAAPRSHSLSWGDCKFNSYFAFWCFRISSVSQRDAKRHRPRIAWFLFPEICKISRSAVLFASFSYLRNKTLGEKADSAWHTVRAEPKNVTKRKRKREASGKF